MRAIAMIRICLALQLIKKFVLTNLDKLLTNK